MSGPNVSVGWNGVIYTGWASDGKRFGTGVGKTEDEAKAAAIKDLNKNPEGKAPESAGPQTTAAREPERIAAKRGVDRRMKLSRLRDAWAVLTGQKVATAPPQLIANPSFQSGMTEWYTTGTGTGWTFTGNSFSE